MRRQLLSVSLPWDLAALVDREVERRGVTKTELVETALRSYLGAETRLDVEIQNRWLAAVADKASQMGREPSEIVEALVRRGVTNLTEDEVDPERAALRAKQRAKELLG